MSSNPNKTPLYSLTDFDAMRKQIELIAQDSRQLPQVRLLASFLLYLSRPVYVDGPVEILEPIAPAKPPVEPVAPTEPAQPEPPVAPTEPAQPEPPVYGS